MLTLRSGEILDKNQRTSIQRDKIFVVEGSNDLDFLSSFIEKECKRPSCLDQLWFCIDRLEQDKIYIKPNNLEKARCLSFLSTRKEFSNTVGIAAKKGYWNFKHTIFDDFRQFVQKMLVD